MIIIKRILERILEAYAIGNNMLTYSHNVAAYTIGGIASYWLVERCAGFIA